MYQLLTPTEVQECEVRFLLSGQVHDYSLSTLPALPKQLVTIRDVQQRNGGIEMTLEPLSPAERAPQQVALSDFAARRLGYLFDVQSPAALAGRQLPAYVDNGTYVGLSVPLPPPDHQDFVRLQEAGFSAARRSIDHRLRRP